MGVDSFLRLGTRGSPLALAQAHMTAAALEVAHHWLDGRVEIVPITTSGDKVQDLRMLVKETARRPPFGVPLDHDPPGPKHPG